MLDYNSDVCFRGFWPAVDNYTPTVLVRTNAHDEGNRHGYETIYDLHQTSVSAIISRRYLNDHSVRCRISRQPLAVVGILLRLQADSYAGSEAVRRGVKVQIF